MLIVKINKILIFNINLKLVVYKISIIYFNSNFQFKIISKCQINSDFNQSLFISIKCFNKENNHRKIIILMIYTDFIFPTKFNHFRIFFQKAINLNLNLINLLNFEEQF